MGHDGWQPLPCLGAEQVSDSGITPWKNIRVDIHCRELTMGHKMTARALYISVCWLCLMAVCYGHGIKASQLEGGIGVVVTYDEGSPASFSEVKLFAPNVGDTPALTGTTDRNGCFMFRPDTNGVWKIAVDDGMGHAATETIQVEENAMVSTGETNVMPKRYGVTTGLAVIFAVFGWAAFMRVKFAGKTKG